MKIAYIFNRYPVLTQRFLEREIEGLRANGIEVEIFSLFGSEARNERTSRAKNYLATIPAALFAARHAREFRARKIQMVHGVWATAPATAAAALHRLCGIPFSFGAQAFDLYRHGGDPFLRTKARAAAFVQTSTRANASYLEKFSPRKIVFARRGLAEFPPPFHPAPLPPPLRILSVARLVEKKGHAQQLAACAALKNAGVPFQLRIVGDGPLHARLTSKIARLGLQEVVELAGALAAEETDAAYRWAHIFWHSGVVAADGDRDGLPNVIPEAMAHGLAVISSRAPGAMEAVMDGETGLLAEADELAAATLRLLDDAALRERLGANARRWVEENFRAEKNAAILAEGFREAVERRGVPAPMPNELS